MTLPLMKRFCHNEKMVLKCFLAFSGLPKALDEIAALQYISMVKITFHIVKFLQ